MANQAGPIDPLVSDGLAETLSGREIATARRDALLALRLGHLDGMRNSEDAGDMNDEPVRCGWASNALAIFYHDAEWGVPVHDERCLFEFLTLEGAQAGLSWDTILRKRDRYRVVFAGFDPALVARFDDRKIAALLDDAGIVRNRLKVRSTVSNAQAFLAVQESHGSFDSYLWSFVDGTPIQSRWSGLSDVPVSTACSDALAKDLKKRGFRFVGTTICYALMQAVGMVNDHLVTCFRHRPCGGSGD